MSNKSIVILGIESSCDETSASVLRDGKVLSNLIAGQQIHRDFGGVVPELASRSHLLNIIPVVSEALSRADVSKTEISAVAFTQGPGLLGSLLVGSSFAKALAWGLHVPLIAVHHTQAHILAHFIEPPYPKFPFLCLTVSGGHTQLVEVSDYLKMKILGQTIDDAAGEAFDKAAKMLALPYPGGPLIDKLAKEGNPRAFTFTEPKAPNFDFSFSGLKTSILYFLQQQTKHDPMFIENNKPDLCASIQYTIVNILSKKIIETAKATGITEIAVAGGVSANSALRERIQEIGKEYGWNVYIPRFEYCTDNAAMIAITGYYQYLAGDFADLEVVPKARMSFS